MDLGKTFSNPWVIGGGLGLIALVYILSSSGSSSNSSAANSYSSALASNNAINAANFNTSTAAAVALGTAAYQNSSTMAGYLAGALTNIANINGQVAIGQAQSNAGIFSTIANANAAEAMTISNNAARVQNVGQQTIGNVVDIGTNARASQNIAQSAAGAANFSSLTGALTSIFNNAAPKIAAAA